MENIKPDIIINNLKGLDLEIYIEFSKLVDEDTLLSMIEVDPDLIDDIPKPSENAMIQAVSSDGYSLRFIRNPPDSVIIEAVKQNGLMFDTIKNPSEYVLLELVKFDGAYISEIDNPTYEMEMAAVTNNGLVISNIYQPNEELQLKSVEKTGSALSCILNPTPKVQQKSVERFIIGYLCLKGINRTDPYYEYFVTRYNLQGLNYENDYVFHCVPKIKDKKLLKNILEQCTSEENKRKISQYLKTLK